MHAASANIHATTAAAAAATPCVGPCHVMCDQEVLSSPAVAPVTTKLECAKLADGAAALLLVPASKATGNSRGAVLVLPCRLTRRAPVSCSNILAAVSLQHVAGAYY